MLSLRVYASGESPRHEAVSLSRLSLITFDQLDEEAAPKETLVLLFPSPLSVSEYTDIKLIVCFSVRSTVLRSFPSSQPTSQKQIRECAPNHSS